VTAGLETSPGAGLDDIDWPALRELCEAHLQLCEAARGRLLPGDGAAYMQAEDACRDRLGDIVFADPWSAPAELARLRVGEPPCGALLTAAGGPGRDGDEHHQEDDSEQAEDDDGPWHDLAELSAEDFDALSEQIASRILALAGPDGVALAEITARVMSDPSVIALAYPRSAGAHPAGGWGFKPAWRRGAAESGPDVPDWQGGGWAEPPSIRAGEPGYSGASQPDRPPRSRNVRQRRAQQRARAMRRARQRRAA
jgi:hypothetical protein